MTVSLHGKALQKGLLLLRRRWHEEEKLRFLVIGAANTLSGYLIFIALYLITATWLHYLIVALFSHFIAVILAFCLQRSIVFRSRGSAWSEFIRYNISLLTILGAGMMGLYLFVSGVGLPPLLAQTFVTLLTVIGSYLAHRHFSFRIRTPNAD